MTEAAHEQNELIIDAPLAEQLERKGVHLHPGDRVRLEVLDGGRDHELSSTKDANQSEDPLADFIGTVHAGPDFASRAEELLQHGFGRS